MSENQIFCLVTHFHIAIKKKREKNTFIFQRHDTISTKNLLRLKRMPFTLNRKLETGFKDVDGFTVFEYSDSAFRVFGFRFDPEESLILVYSFC
jgi:hypothetical protein